MKDEDLLLNRKTNFPEIMSIAEAAAYLTISKYFLYTLVKGGFVPYAQIGKRIVFKLNILYNMHILFKGNLSKRICNSLSSYELIWRLIVLLLLSNNDESQENKKD